MFLIENHFIENPEFGSLYGPKLSSEKSWAVRTKGWMDTNFLLGYVLERNLKRASTSCSGRKPLVINIMLPHSQLFTECMKKTSMWNRSRKFKLKLFFGKSTSTTTTTSQFNAHYSHVSAKLKWRFAFIHICRVFFSAFSSDYLLLNSK